LEKQHQQYKSAVDALSQSDRTTMVLVSRPQKAALEEAARTSGELTAVGVRNQRLVLNGLMPPRTRSDALGRAMAERDRWALERMPEALSRLTTDHVYLQPGNVVGIEALRSLLRPCESAADKEETDPSIFAVELPSLSDLTDAVEADSHGLVMVMGKGGVGKTTIAAALAVELAMRGHEVHLTTTDPAAHIASAIESQIDRLQISRIDPQAETEQYRRHVLATKGESLDAAGRALLEEDLRSPCTEEIAVFQAFSKIIGEADRKFVIMDTAPTGHTLLLLDAAGSYHRDIMRHMKDGARIVTPMMRLQNPKQTKILIVALPETTPVLEAAALQADLRRAQIEPWAWVINGSLLAAGTTDPLLARRARAEVEQIEKVRNEFSGRTYIVPWAVEEPVGAEQLRRLVNWSAVPLQTIPKLSGDGVPAENAIVTSVQNQ
jgi:arsenite-transporting ATPase